MKKLIFLFIGICVVMPLIGQQVQPVSLQIVENPGKVSYATDLNGNQCARMTIICPAAAINKVEGNIIGALESTGNGCVVALTAGTKSIKIHSSVGTPVQVFFRPLGVNALQGGVCYRLTLSVVDENSKELFKIEKGLKSFNETLPEKHKTMAQLKEMASRGDGDAKAALGACYLNGTGMEKDYKLAHAYFKEAADMGNSRGINGLGVLYENGLHVTMDKKKAVSLYERAAKAGFPIAYTNLGLCYEDGLGVAPDSKKALECYRTAADLGDADACGYLACLLYNNGDFAESEMIVKYISKGISMNDARSYLTGGGIYQFGDLGPRDLKKAYEYFLKASELGNVIATTETGKCYYWGWGTAVNMSKAFMYFKMAASEGDPEAQCFLGDCYRYGNGTMVSKSDALEWYRKSAAQEWEEAIKTLEEYK